MRKNSIYTFFCLFALLPVGDSFAQKSKADSLQDLIQTDKNDTNKVVHLNNLAVELWSDLDTAIYFSNQALQISKALETGGWKIGMGRSHYQLGMFYYDKGDFTNALSHDQQSLSIRSEERRVGKECRL